jgi:acyl carrier protein
MKVDIDKLKNIITLFFKNKTNSIDFNNIFNNLDSLETMSLISHLEKKLAIKLNIINLLDKKKINLKFLYKNINK